jgi:hypothetical protein
MPLLRDCCFMVFCVGLLSAPRVLAQDLDQHGEEEPGAERFKRYGVDPDKVRPGLAPFVISWDDATPGALDLSFLNHKPAGSLGLIKTGPDGDLYAGNEKIRFLGTNLIFAAAAPEKERAPKIAAHLAKYGINVVRFHHIDNKSVLLRDRTTTRVMDPASLDRLDFLIAELKKNGIYSNLNLLVSRSYLPGDGLGPELKAVSGKIQALLGFWHAPAFELHQEYARQLLSHRNPYTGLTYAEDPAVAFVEIINENGLANTWYAEKGSKHHSSLALHELPEVYRAPLRERWNAWLTQRHGSLEMTVAAWAQKGGSDLVSDLLVDGVAQLVPNHDFRERPLPLRLDWLDFLRDVERDYYRRMTDFIRKDLGSQALITHSTAASGWLNVAAESDVVDGHVYWENPRWRGKTWDWAGLDWHITNENHVAAGPGGRLRWLAMYQLADKPYSVTEYNHGGANVHSGDTALYLAAHAALQGWDAIYLFKHFGGSDWDNAKFMGNAVCHHPTKMANLLPAALLFRRGDLSKAEKAIRVHLSPQTELQLAATKGSSWNLANGFKIGVDGDSVLRHRIEIVTGDQAPAEVWNPSYQTAAVVTSDHGQVRHTRAHGKDGIMTINTPRAKSVLGLAAGRHVAFGAFDLVTKPTMDGGCAVSCLVLEGEDFARAKRALIVATARAENTGMLWKKVVSEANPAETVYELESWGQAPTLIEPVQADFLLHGNRSFKVYALDELGQRAGEVKTFAPNFGQRGFSIGGNGHAPTLFYEIEWGE